MAKATVSRPPAFVGQLKAALQKELRGAKVCAEQIRGSRYRFEVLWDKFSGIGHPQRQRQVWSIAERIVSRDDLFDVGMILTVAPDER